MVIQCAFPPIFQNSSKFPWLLRIKRRCSKDLKMRPKGKRGIVFLLQFHLEFQINFLILLFLGQPPPPFSIPFLRSNCISACSLLALPKGSPPACLGPPTDTRLCLDRGPKCKEGTSRLFPKGIESPWFSIQISATVTPQPPLPNASHGPS